MKLRALYLIFSQTLVLQVLENYFHKNSTFLSSVRCLDLSLPPYIDINSIYFVFSMHFEFNSKLSDRICFILFQRNN